MKSLGRVARGALVVVSLAVPFQTPQASAASAVKGMKAIPCPDQNGHMFFTAPRTQDNRKGLWFGQPCAGFGAIEWGTKATKKQPARRVFVVVPSGTGFSWDVEALKAFATRGTPVPTKVDWIRGRCCTLYRHDFDAKAPSYILARDGVLMPWKTPKGTIFDTFGPGNTFHCCGGNSVTSPGAGHPPADHDLAQTFEVPEGRDVTLKGLDLALGRNSGPNVFDLFVTKTRPISHQWGGFQEEPDLSAAGIVETWRASGLVKDTPWSGSPTPEFVVHLDSAKRPMLRAGERYWVVLSVPEPDSAMVWWGGTRPEGPVYSAERNSAYLNAWESHGPADGGYALRVTTRPAR
jgi:hypothetical protein